LQDSRGNSTIVIGAHASGKTTLIKQVLRETSENEIVTVIELPGRVYEETQTALKFLLGQMRALLGIESRNDFDEAELSEFVLMARILHLLVF
jgi:ABC-type cobalamin/Fe3+-siderophores transport system ATPase subunit